MTAAIASFIGNLLMTLLGWYIKKVEKDEDMIKSYYSFLSIMDKKTHSRVTERLSSEESLDILQKRVRQRRAEKRSALEAIKKAE